MKKTAIIMAGGYGERFWPKSRKNMPKQFLSLTGDGKTMIQLSVDRILPIVDIQDVFVVTNIDYVDIVASQLPNLPRQNILAEPQGRNTAPCIAFASAVIAAKYDDAVCFVLASDHIIKNKKLFTDTLNVAAAIAEAEDNIVTMGITPNYPETGYGYIEFSTDEALKYSNSYKVVKFVEKPDASKAAQYVEDGRYLWNSGMFVWRLQTILKSYQSAMPELYNSLLNIKNAVGTPDFSGVVQLEFARTKAESIDYGIMEKVDNLYTMPGSFGWDDVGGWLALERINKTDENGNYLQGNIINLDTENSIIISSDKLVATVGINNLVVVVEGDAILVCNKDSTQSIKKVVKKLKDQKLSDYL